MELTDLLPLEKWKKLEKHLHERSGLDVNVFDREGIRITDYKQWVNRLCPRIKADDRGQSYICAVAHMNIAEMARQSGEPTAEECDAGLLKFVVPIVVTGEFLGSVGACGLILEEGEVDSFMINRTIGMEDDEIEELTYDIKHISQSEADQLGKYIREKLDEIIAGYQRQHS